MKTTLSILALLATYATCSVYQIPLDTSVYIYNAAQVNPQFAQLISLSNHSTICANISLGTPAQYFNVLLDTTSSSFWIAGVGYEGTPGLTTYNSTASTTYYSSPGSLNDLDNILGNGSPFIAEGNMAMDTLQIGNFTYYDTVFGEANFVQNPVPGIDGILGLGFPQIDLCSGVSSMEQILRDGDFDNVSFSLFYSSTSQSYLFLGGIDSTYATSDFVYFSLIGNGMWGFIGSLYYGTVPLAKNVEFIVDTTSPGLIYLPQLAANNYAEASGLFMGTTYENDVLHWLRPLLILVGGQEINLSASDYMTCSDNLCQTVLIPQKDRENSVILGTGFLELFYTHFDYENNRIGFSPRA